MIVELVKSYMIPCPRLVRQMGYPQELVAIEARHARHRAAWAPHVAATHDAIRRAIAKLDAQSRRRAVVLGSGPLLDVPVAELAAAFDEVVLVDLLHAPWAISRARAAAGERAPRLRFMAGDVTGSLQAIADAVQAARLARRPPPLPLPRCQPGLVLPGPIDLAISVGLLTQLAGGPLGHVEDAFGKTSALPDAEADAFAGHLQRAHVAWLAGLGGSALLVSDLSRRFVDRAGATIEEDSLVPQGLLPAPEATWTWDIAPLGEHDRRYAEQRRVGAFALEP